MAPWKGHNHLRLAASCREMDIITPFSRTVAPDTIKPATPTFCIGTYHLEKGP
jgi:hypothetical protein